jgi:hypothetical protein
LECVFVALREPLVHQRSGSTLRLERTDVRTRWFDLGGAARDI